MHGLCIHRAGRTTTPGPGRTVSRRRVGQLRVLALAFVAGVGGVAAAQEASPSPNPPTWNVVEGESVALERDGVVRWRFNFGPDRTKPCFHPLALGATQVLTVDAPKDHPWHHGLWFSWKFIDGVNFWEHDAKAGRPLGRTSWTLLEKKLGDEGTARFVLEVEYRVDETRLALRERRVITVAAPERNGAFVIDWDADFEAASACRLERTPPPGEEGGKANGGYAGLSCRLAQMERPDALSSAGIVAWNAQDRARPVGYGFDYRGTLDGHEVGVAILDHPENLHAPTAWYAIRSKSMSFFTPAVLVPRPLSLAAKDRFRLRYRILVHPGRLDAAQLAEAVAAFHGTRSGESK